MFDYIIVGGGIVGTATAWQLLQRQPGKRVLLLDKEPVLARHQTGRNSGVIHAGVYYPPGSLKAQFCKQGLRDTLDFCRRYSIPFNQCGKLLVATTPLEVQRMESLRQRCVANGLKVLSLNRSELLATEPNIDGLGALFVKETGIVDYAQVCKKMAEQFVALGGELLLGAELTGICETADEIVVQTSRQEFHGRFLIACGGLMADRIAQMQGLADDFRIIPFRGEYYRLPKSLSSLINHLIYPIPDPAMPFLGVHLTRMIDGSVTVGPNAVLGWQREGYGKCNVDRQDSWQVLSFPGFWRLMLQHWQSGLHELKNSFFKSGYLREVQKYCPQLTLDDLQPHPVGVRAQAVLKDGALVHDFLFKQTPRSLHVCNAPSPAATSAIPIGGYICEMLTAG